MTRAAHLAVLLSSLTALAGCAPNNGMSTFERGDIPEWASTPLRVAGESETKYWTILGMPDRPSDFARTVDGVTFRPTGAFSYATDLWSAGNGDVWAIGNAPSLARAIARLKGDGSVEDHSTVLGTLAPAALVSMRAGHGGVFVSVTNPGTRVLRWDGTAFVEVPGAPETIQLDVIEVTGPDAALFGAVGAGEGHQLYAYASGTWRQVATAFAPMNRWLASSVEGTAWVWDRGTNGGSGLRVTGTQSQAFTITGLPDNTQPIQLHAMSDDHAVLIARRYFGRAPSLRVLFVAYRIDGAGKVIGRALLGFCAEATACANDAELAPLDDGTVLVPFDEDEWLVGDAAVLTD